MICRAASATCVSATGASVRNRLRFHNISDSVAPARFVSRKGVKKLSHPQVSNKSYVIAVCLSGIFGVIGIQHFYLERWIEAILDLSLFIATIYLLFTGQWLWAVLAGAVDALHTLIVTILLLTGKFNDGHGKRVCYPGQRLRAS